MCPSSSRVEPSSLRRLKAYCPSRSVRSQPLHSTLNSCCGNDAEAVVMKSRLICRSTRTTAGLSQFLLGENFTVIPRCGQTHRIGTRRIGTRRIRVRYRMFALRRPFRRKTNRSCIHLACFLSRSGALCRSTNHSHCCASVKCAQIEVSSPVRTVPAGRHQMADA